MTEQWTFNRRASADDVLRGRDLAGKTMIVTGANTGIGFHTARALAWSGARVILACRDAASGEAAVKRVCETRPGSHAEYAALDLGSLASVRAFCERLDAQKIDVLICNAGLMPSTYQQTTDGFERTVGVCHLGHFALVQWLLPRLLAAGLPRVVMVSSELHRLPATLQFGRFPLNANNYSSATAYGQAKLCNALMAKELQRRYGGLGLTACSLHPGNMINTDFGRESLLVRTFMTLLSPFAKNPNQGAATSVFAAVHEPASDIAGTYLADCRPRAPSPEVGNAETARRLWELSEGWIGVATPSAA